MISWSKNVVINILLFLITNLNNLFFCRMQKETKLQTDLLGLLSITLLSVTLQLQQMIFK